MFEDSLGSLTINADPARQSLSALGRDFDAMGNSFDRATDKMVKEAETTVRETRRLAEASREWKRLEETIGGSTAAMEKFNRLSGEADRALASGRINAEQHSLALERLGSRYKATGDEAVRSTKLAAHEINNLSFQIQDLAVQVGSGQGLFRPLLQQGPQAVGAVGGVGRAISLLATPTAAAAAGFAALAAGAAVVASRVAEISEEGRRLDATLRGLNPMLDANSTSLRTLSFGVASDTGATRREAAGIIAQVVRNRQIVGTEMVRQISELAADMGPVLGDDPAKIGGQLAGAFSKGAAGIRELDKELGFLTPELAHTIRNLDEGGRRAEALGLAMGALKDRFGGAARGVESEWTKSTKAMSEQWDTFVERVSKSELVTTGVKIGTQMLKWVTPDIPEDKQAARMREVDSALSYKMGQLQDAVSSGAKGRGVDLMRDQVKSLQDEYYGLVKAITDAKKAQDDFSLGQGGRWGATGWNTPAPVATSAANGGITPDEQKRIDDLTHAYGREAEAMRGNSVERSIRLAGLAAENTAIEAGRTAQAAKAERDLAEGREIASLVTGHGDLLDSMRREVDQQELVARAARGGTAARQEAERAARVALETSEMLRAADAAEARGKEDLAGQLRGLAREYDGLSRRGADASKLGGVNDLTAQNEADIRMSRADAGTIGMSDGDRQRVLGAVRAQNELLRQGVDLQGDLTPEVRAAAEEYMRSSDALTQMNNQVEQQRKSWEAMADSLGTAFDKVGDSLYKAMTSKDGKPITFKSLFGDALRGLDADMFKMSFLNPIKNMLLGASAPTLNDAFGSVMGMQQTQSTTAPIGPKSAIFELLSSHTLRTESAK